MATHVNSLLNELEEYVTIIMQLEKDNNFGVEYWVAVLAYRSLIRRVYY